MLKQAIGQTAANDTLLDSGWHNLGNISSDRSILLFDSNSLFESGQADSAPFTTDTSTDHGLMAGSRTMEVSKANLLNIMDAPDSGDLFGLSTHSINASGNPITQVGYDSSIDYPIEWGNPLSDQYYWRQQSGPESCAVVAQISVYESLTGYYIDEQSACNYAQAQGWFNPQTGTPLMDIGKILNALGIHTTQEYNASLSDIAIALNAGDKPIVGLDANEIWHPQHDQNGNPIEQPDAGHAVWVTGIDATSNGSYNIILNDSGISTGRSEVVNYRDFYNAWSDYNYFLTVADNPFT